MVCGCHGKKGYTRGLSDNNLKVEVFELRTATVEIISKVGFRKRGIRSWKRKKPTTEGTVEGVTGESRSKTLTEMGLMLKRAPLSPKGFLLANSFILQTLFRDCEFVRYRRMERLCNRESSKRIASRRRTNAEKCRKSLAGEKEKSFSIK